MDELYRRRCTPCTGKTPVVPRGEAVEKLRDLAGWTLSEDGTAIRAEYAFKNFHETMGFANAVAWMANQEDHHPDLELSYARCAVRYSTHAVGGLSENDFICAAKVDRLFSGG